MADDSLDIPEIMDFHSCDPPYHMKKYILTDLTVEQQTELNKLKADTVRANQKYLQKHPEIRAIIFIILKQVMRARPRTNLHKFIGQYFIQSTVDIREEIECYLEARKLSLAEKKICDRSDISHREKNAEKAERKRLAMERAQAQIIAQEVVELIIERSICETESQKTAKEAIEDIIEHVFDVIENIYEIIQTCADVVLDVVDTVLDYIEPRDPTKIRSKSKSRRLDQFLALKVLEAKIQRRLSLNENVMESFGFTVRRETIKDASTLFGTFSENEKPVTDGDDDGGDNDDEDDDEMLKRRHQSLMRSIIPSTTRPGSKPTSRRTSLAQ